MKTFHYADPDYADEDLDARVHALLPRACHEQPGRWCLVESSTTQLVLSAAPDTPVLVSDPDRDLDHPDLLGRARSQR